MNLTIGKTNIGDLRNNIKARYIGSAGGAVLAFSAIAGFSGALSSNAGVQASSVLQPRGVSYAENSIVPVSVPIRVYVAENREQATAMDQEQARFLMVAAFNGLPLPALTTIVVRDSALEQDLLSAAGSVAAIGQTVEVMTSPAR